MHKKATPNSTPVATHRRRRASATAGAAEPDAHEVLGMKRLDDGVAGGGDGREHASRAAPRRARRRPRPPAGAGYSPKARTTHASTPSTAWDRYHRCVASCAGAHHGKKARVTAGTRASHHVGEPMSGRKARTNGEVSSA